LSEQDFFFFFSNDQKGSSAPQKDVPSSIGGQFARAPRSAGRGVSPAPIPRSVDPAQPPIIVRAKKPEQQQQQDLPVQRRGESKAAVEADEEFVGASGEEPLEEAEVLLDTLDADGLPVRRAKPKSKDKDAKRTTKAAGGSPKPLPVIVKDVDMMDKTVAARLQTKQRRAVPSAGRGKGAFDAKQWEASQVGSDPDVSFSLGEILRRSSDAPKERPEVKSRLISRKPSPQLQELQQQRLEQAASSEGGERRKVYKPKKSTGPRREIKDADGKTAMDRRMEAQADTAQIDLEGISDDKERCVLFSSSGPPFFFYVGLF
jgi:hypothetical protein